jgi:hypothetical protein
MGLLDGLFGTEKGTTTTKSAPWEPQQPYLQNLFSRGNSLYGQSQDSPYQTLLNNRMNQPSPITNAGQGLALNALQGKFLDPYSNPHFSGALNQTLGNVRSQINSQFTGDNFGNSAHQEWLGRGLTNAALPMLANQYNAERANQMGVLGMSPQIANQDLDLAQRAEQAPWQNLFNFQQAVSGNYGGTQETPYYINNTANTLGMLASGVGAYYGMGGGK